MNDLGWRDPIEIIVAKLQRRGEVWLECVLVLTGELPAQPSANLMLDELFGAKIVNVPDRADRDVC